MNEHVINTLSTGRKIYQKLFKPPDNYGINQDYGDAELRFQEASDFIRSGLAASKPMMVARFGAVELSCLVNFLGVRSNQSFTGYKKYFQGKVGSLWWEDHVVNTMSNNAGFFPATPLFLEKFCRLLIEDMRLVDVLGSWLKEERLFEKELSHAMKVRLPDIEPYYHPAPWSELLKGKKILVVHPFEESIKQQYKKRKLLFANENVLPEFDLITLKAVQTIAGSKTNFKDWFEALDSMKDKINDIDFDIALIGCGAYGFPLAAHVKRIGKKSVHFGGSLQILFGIKGKRWEKSSIISGLFNDHWKHPSPEETPQNFLNVEEGAYW